MEFSCHILERIFVADSHNIGLIGIHSMVSGPVVNHVLKLQPLARRQFPTTHTHIQFFLHTYTSADLHTEHENICFTGPCWVYVYSCALNVLGICLVL